MLLTIGAENWAMPLKRTSEEIGRKKSIKEPVTGSKGDGFFF
jgi:hypothetical protein